jgi:RimJ/RimL family protein N-acetyltransferase
VQPPPPDRIDLGGVVLRRWTHADVPALTAAAQESLDHLQPFMSWATPEQTTEAAFHEFVDATTARAADGSEAVFGVFDATTGAVLGGCGLHDRLPVPGGLEIGYWLHVDATGRGLMTHIAGHLTQLALGWPGITRVEIHCDRANLRSAAVPQRLGYRLDRIEPSDRPLAPADTGEHMIWVHEPGSG